MRFACSNLSRNFSKFKSHFLRENKVAWIPKINALFHSCLFTCENKTREILFRQNPIKKLNESDYRKQTINSSQSRLSQTWKDSKRKSKSKFRVFLSVKTCEVFLFFLIIIFLGYIVLTPQWLLCIHCFTSLVSFTGFFTEDEPKFRNQKNREERRYSTKKPALRY